MSSNQPILKGAFPGGALEEYSGSGKRPVIFDIVSHDMTTSLLPPGLKLVLHVNPKSMSFKYEKIINRIQTKGGFVEQHWGEGARTIDFDMATGGLMRLYSGPSYTTSPAMTGGSRRETLAYDSYLDILALFHNNGTIYDANGNVAIQGAVKITFDGGVYLGWFNSFSVQESAETPYQFTMSAAFEVEKEVQVWRSVFVEQALSDPTLNLPEAQTSQPPLEGE